jgi:hypothetical protein
MTGSDRLRERMSAAYALWHNAGDPEPVLPVLRSAWTENPRTRGTTAALLTEMGPAGAPLWDLVTTELATPRRHTARAGGYGNDDILKDERLLRRCREVVGDG